MNQATLVAQTRRGPIEYLESGAGPAVLALHGAMGGCDQSDILARTVGGTGYRYVAVSRPGYLGTPITVGRSPEEQADALAALLDALNIEKAVVMAVSGGGPSALHFAMRHAARCRGLVLISTCGDVVHSRIPFAFRVMQVLMRWPAVARRVRKNAARNFEANLRRSIEDPAVLARVLQDTEVRPLLEELTVGMFDRVGERLCGTSNDIAVSRSCSYPLEQIAAPTLVVHGTLDKLVPFAQHAKLLASRIPGAELFAVEGGEHVAIFTHRNDVRERVAGFLRGLN